jgi:hypothetical protein
MIMKKIHSGDSPVLASFKDFAGNLKPMLDEDFIGHLTDFLGDTVPLRSAGGTKVLVGGKRIRGALLCLVTSALGGDLENAIPRAAAIELIQTATLIHDDFIDQHEHRRNVPAMWTLEGGRKAVLLGDVIFSSAIHMMSELGRKDGLIVSRAIAEIARGAYQEPLHPEALLEKIKEDKEGTIYEKIIYLKTGVLFGAACQLGAVAAGADDMLQSAWRHYGLKIGEAYQIADDLHEVERYLLSRTITPGEMISVAPALLFFSRESRYILKALRMEQSDWNGELPEQFQNAALRMKQEIENRLHSAVSAIEWAANDNEYGQLARTAPWDIIRMFNEAEPVVSSR